MTDRAGRWLPFAIAALTLSFLFFRISHTVADPDLWGHVRFGQDIWETGRIIQADPYSYLTEGHPWINHEWLAELSFFLAWHLGGATGLIVLKTALAMVVYTLAYCHLIGAWASGPLGSDEAGKMPALPAALLMLPVLVTTQLGLSMLRPQIYTYVFFLITLILMERAEKGQYRWLWAMPVVVALWTNLHGGVLAGIAVFGLWCAAHLACGLLRRPRAPVRGVLTVVLTGLLSLAALAVNPYGVELVRFLLRTATVPRPEVPEWHPISFGGPEDFVYLMLAVLGVAAFVLSKRPRRFPLLAVFLVTAFLPWSAYRHVPLFALAFVVLAGEHVADLWNRLFQARRGSAFPGGAWERGVVASLLIGGMVLLGFSLPHFRAIHFGPRYNVTYPTRAVALLKAAGVKGNLVILYDWGEYALWHLYPHVKVSMDGRRETVYSDEVYAEDMAFRYGLAHWDAVLQRPEADMALVSKDFVSFKLLSKEPGWVLVYQDPLCGLFVRANGPLLEKLQATQPPDMPFDGEGMTFP